ncbi:MAG: PAS domain S-box protein [Anaerolineales bacterium]|nr:PAS domain S-box protein [Anaerolineales bacterium]
MPKINTIYLISHTHTDIGYTDHQDTVFRQHLEFIDQAIELGEATAHYPEHERYKWTCEVTSFVERYFASRPSHQVDRFLALHRRGQMAVAAMQYHWTPMLSTAGMLRSLLPVLRLRRDFGLNITTAMQCDVNGASWRWADLLPAIGVDSFTMSINMHRGRRPEPDLTAFWVARSRWRQGAGVQRPHYLYGIFRYGLGDEATTLKLLPGALATLEARTDYPYDFLYAQVTHPARVDNGPPLPNLAEFVRNWNAAGHTPAMQFVTVDAFTRLLHSRYGAQAPTWQGDWADWWADGVGSSAYETSLNRATEELLPLLDLLATQTGALDPHLLEEAYHLVSLYDEHTWGGFASIRRPHSPFTRANFNRKAGFAYGGYGVTHELLAAGGRQLARDLVKVPPEGDAWRRWGQYFSAEPSADPGAQRFLVVNPSGWTRHIRWHLPPDMGGATPYAILEMFLVGNYRERPPLESPTPAGAVIDVELPPFGYAVVPYRQLGISPAAHAGEGIIENQWYKVTLDAATGAIRSWWDKTLGCELVDQGGPWRFGQYVYEWIDHPDDRRALFALNFDRADFGVRFTDTPFRRAGPSIVELLPAQVVPGGVTVEVRLAAPGARSVRVRYSLPDDEPSLHIDMVVDKEQVTRAEAIYVVFPFAMENPTFHLDLNGVAMEPDSEQLPGSCRDWYGIQRWAEVGDATASVTLAPLDAPLIQVGGITTGRWAHVLDTHAAMLVSWALHNYWDTNFQASQGGEILFRYRLTSSGHYDAAASSRFAMNATTPPLIVRVPGAKPDQTGQWLKVDPEGIAEIQLKRAADGNGIIVHAYNLAAEPRTLLLTPAVAPHAAYACSPLEENGAALTMDHGRVACPPPRGLLAHDLLKICGRTHPRLMFHVSAASIRVTIGTKGRTAPPTERCCRMSLPPKAERTALRQSRREPPHEPAAPAHPHDQQTWYRALFNQNPSAIILSAPDSGAVIAANPEACRVLGYTEANLHTLTLAAIFDATDPRWAVAVDTCTRTGAFRGELTARRSDGTCMPVEVTTSICIGDEGRPAVAHIFQDISERLRREAASREAETKFAMLFHSSPVPLHLARLEDGFIIDVNEAAAAMFGFDRAEMLGRTGIELGIVTPAIRAAVLASAQDNQVRDHEITLTCKSGEVRNCLLSADILDLAQEHCLLISIIDVTARKQAERERAFMAAIVECAQDAIIGRDLDGFIVSWNAAAAAMFGWSIEDAIGMHITQGFPASRLQEFTTNSDDLQRHGFRRRSETQRQTKDGRIIDVAVSSSVVHDEKGEVLGIASIARDITEQKRFEAQVRESEEKYRFLTETMKDVVCTIDLDTPTLPISPSITPFARLHPGGV